MGEQFEISVVIGTYNRCRMLPRALESVLAQDAGGVGFEVIVVDNNSTDDTRGAVESFISRGHSNLRYIFEGRQGVSYARNTGIAHARAPVIAFTDDDVRVAPDWVANIKRAFEEHPEVDYVGGRVLPLWEGEPPAWLTPRHWSPLALADYGDEPVYSDGGNPICLVAANLAFRRGAFERFGLFSPDLQRVQDHELLTKVWRGGGRGLYLPKIVVSAEVQPERTTKDYHRRWHTGHGYYYAVMRESGFEQSSVRLFDVPGHLLRRAGGDALGWLICRLRGDSDEAFAHEVGLRFFVGFYRRRRADYFASGKKNRLYEITRFMRALTGRKAGGARCRGCGTRSRPEQPVRAPKPRAL